METRYSQSIIFNASIIADPAEWEIVNDDVMGGLSIGQIQRTSEGHLVFSGQISRAFGGGFASVRLSFGPLTVSDASILVVKLKGDGKNYQFRLRESIDQRHAFVFPYQTSGAWEILRLPLNEFYPVFRGKTLDLPKFRGSEIAQFSLLIGNKKEEDFRLEFAYIGLE